MRVSGLGSRIAKPSSDFHAFECELWPLSEDATDVE